jgi:plasmanylethanolamine desaturase
MQATLPELEKAGRLTRCIEAASIVGACSLIILHAIRFFNAAGLFTWRVAVAVLAALVLADFASGVIHWTADTWGSEALPVLGRRFLRPFRVHHINPDDFLRRDLIDTNGDVAVIAIALFLSALLIPLVDEFQRLAATLLFAFGASVLPTNQIHQWAHMSRPPSLVHQLQRRGLILSRESHDKHHISPYVMNYCIITGWCNWPLTATGFFPALEWIITRVTGLTPRRDELAFASLLEAPVAGMNEAVVKENS